MSEASSPEGIAIVGMAGRFPGASSVDEFWRNLVAGKESVSFFSEEELAASGVDAAALRDTKYVPARGIVEGAELFDAPFFGMTAKEAEITDPQQRLILEVAWHALENAGYDSGRFQGLIGVYAGVGINTYNYNNLRTHPELMDLVGEDMIVLGNEKDYLATRLAYKLNLRGPALNVNTACSTALAAIGQACQALLNFQCDLALAGGVYASFPQKRGALHQEGGFASPDGHTRVFDAKAGGTVFSDGLGVVALKRLAEAIEDGDQIYAVVKGVGINNDGSAKVGFTAPSVDGQAEAIALAQADAGVDPDSLSYIECHGTATPIGDPIEIAALTQAFRLRTQRKHFCAIGSVKSNIGHLGAAAGAAGLIKTALALKNKVLPASLHYTAPNPKIDFANSPFFVNAKLTEWKAGKNPRRAGVSAFGFGGTNVHVVLEEAPEIEASSDSREWKLFVLSAKSEAALDAATTNLAGHLKANPDLNLADAAYTLQLGRRTFEHRRIIVGRDVAETATALEKREAKRLLSHVRDEDSNPPTIVFMFPGQGSQYVGMGADLYRTEPVFKEQIDRCAEILKPSLGLDLRDILYPAPEKAKEAEELLLQTRITQPALFAIEYAVAQLWMSWGIKPSALTGHSLGEYVAACLAGVFTLEDALTLVAKRGELIQGMPRGSMLAVPMTEDELKKILPATLSIAGVNGPAQCVVSGPSAEIDAFLAKLTADGKTGRPLHTSHAFHSAMMDPVLQTFADCVRRMKRGEPTIPFLSNLTGTWISADDARDPQYWARHLRQGVRFADGVKELLKNESAIFLEVGPGTTLGSLVKFQAKKADNRAIISSLRHAREETPDLSAMLTALGQLWMRGVEVDWTAYYGEEKRHRVTMPGYAFQRQRYWIERHVPAPIAPVATIPAPDAALQRNADIADWFYLPTWKRKELSASARDNHLPAALQEWLLFIDEGGFGEKFAESLTAQDKNVTRVLIGKAFKKIANRVYALNPDKAEDYVSLVTELASAGDVPRKIVHFWSVAEPKAAAQLDRGQDLGLHSLLNLVRALGKKGAWDDIDIEVVSSNVQAVTGDETIQPEKSTLIGAVKVIPHEYSNIYCRSVDILIPEAGSKNEQRLLKQLLSEFSAPLSEPVVAYRSGYRWVKRYDSVRLESSAPGDRRLKTNGVYLITGGLGGIGFALAESIAANVQPKLVLVSRSALPPREQWELWLDAHDADDTTSAKIRKVQALESYGAECLVLAANVSDRDAMRKAMSTAKDRFGRIDGVIHAAGNPDFGGVIHRRTREATEDILAPKVKGTLVLDELLAGEKLDFFVLCSTLGNVIDGAIFGQVGYIAANEFLDAFAFSKKAEDTARVISINWDNWRDAGMAADIMRNQLRDGKRTRLLTITNSLDPTEGVEVFNRILAQDFAQVAVSVTDLEARARMHSTDSLYQDAPAPAQETAMPETETVAVAPVGDTEQVLSGIWQELLGVQSVGVDESFFDLGGDSLLLMRVQVKIRELFGADLSSAEMFQYPTISALTQRLSQFTAKASSKPAATKARCAPAETRPALETTVVEFPRTSKDDSHAIAIIGMTGRFPGATNVDEYWRNLVAGVESLSNFSDAELAAAGLDVAAIRKNPNYIASRGIIENADHFDASFFNIGTREAEITDPQQRIFLEGAWEALENAGYDPARTKGYIGVFAGTGTNTYANNLRSHPELIEQVGKIAITVGNEKDYVASRTAYKLNLKGPALSTNTACSTSLVNVCLAVQSLLSRQCDVALAGGVYVSFPQKRANYYQEGGIYSPDGRCRPFDAQAAGTSFNDGLGIVVLKRLNEALRDGDQIHAVIKGVGFNNDGSDKIGFTAPSVQGQAEVITLAQANANVSPDTISYIEAHGTATPLGDPIEIAALTQAFRAGTDKKGFCAIGAVKGNIGHLDAAAGVAGLIKTALALKNKKLPATLNFSSPNPKIDFDNSPFFVNSKLTDWKAGATPRRAGVSAFGIGGTNAHVVLEEAPPAKPATPSRGAQLLVFSAKTATALDSATTRFVAHLKANPEINLADAAYTLQVGRRVFPYRRMLVARDVPDAIQALESMDPKRVITRQTDTKDCPVVFMFPGQGAQYVKMGAELYRSEPEFRSEIDRCAEILAEPLGLDIRTVLFPKAGEEAKAEKLLAETRITQPALFVIEYALARLWISWGVKPQAMLSHSLGEFVAACLAGVFTLKEALTIVAGRSELVQAQPGGAMVAVRLPEQELVPMLPKTMSIAALNSPALSVVAGPFDATEKFEEQLKGKGVISRRLDTSHAFHSAMMDPVIEPFTELLTKVKFQPPTLPYVSNITGRWITADVATDPHYWATHARETVRFADGLGEVLKEPQRALLEVGPGRTLTTFANQHPSKSANGVVLSSILPSDDPEIVEMLNGLGRLWLAGKPVDWSGFYAHEKRRRVPLPTYPFERKRFWIEPNHAVATSVGEDFADETTMTSAPSSAAAPDRKERLVETLRSLFHTISGLPAEDLAPSVSFMELGFDSLSLAQASQTMEKQFGVRIAFRQMLEELSTLNDVAAFLDQKLPPETAPSVPASPASSGVTNSTPAPADASAPAMLDAVQAQLTALTQQLEALRRSTTSSPAPAPAAVVTEKPLEPSASPTSVTEIPLSEPQKELWLASQSGENASRAFNQMFALHIPGRLDHAAVAEIVQQWVDRHDSLRTTFAADGASQIIAPSARLDLPFRDLSALSAADQERELALAADHEAEFAFDLARGPLIRTRLFKLSGERCTLLVNVHHIVLDGWSIGVLMREFGIIYEAQEKGTASGLDPAMQNRDYLQWYESPAHQAIVKQAENYWLGQFSTLPNDIEIPTDRPRPAVQSYRARQKNIVFDSALLETLKRAAAAQGCTLYTYILAGLNAWMYRLSGQEDMIVGIPAAAQLNISGYAGNRMLVGHCVSMLPVRNRCAGDTPFSEHLNAVKQSLLNAYDQQSLTLGSLVRQLQIRRDPSRPPLIPLVFHLGRSSRYIQLPDADFTLLPKHYTFFDLNIEAVDSGHDLSVQCRYNSDLFDDSRIERMLGQLQVLLVAATADPSRKLRDLPLLTEAERQQVVVEWNRTEVAYPKDRLLHQLIEDQAAATPNALAVAFENEELTYRELNARANQLARHLQKLGIGADQLVGICLERSVEMVVGLVGIMKAGGAYVPIDPEYPKQRVAFMLEDSNVSLLLTQARLVDTLPTGTAKLIRLDADWATIARESDAKVDSGVNAENLAYMIYTSGSTGKPKGAMNTHKGILNRLQWMQQEYQLNSADNVLQKTPFSFDVSVWEFFWPLMIGSRLVVAKPGGHRDPGYLAQLIAREKITTLHFVPSMLQLFLAQDGLAASCASLKRVICSGEALPLELQRRFFSVLDTELHNLYGPTEAAVDVTYWACQRDTTLSTVPIGRAIANTQIYILDPQLRPVPIGLPGELHIGGVQLARGYHGRPELTAEKFIADPFSSEPGARLYKTGDLTRFLPDGNIEYLGRLDHQIKIRGLRIELGEIEEALNQYTGIETSVVVAREDSPGDVRLVAYTVNRNKAITSTELRTYLLGRLPDYMVPAAFVALDVMPLSPNGKVERKALPKPDFGVATAKGQYAAPTTATEIAIEKIWCDVLGITQAGIDDNFFEAGGHSMLAVRLLGRINKQLDFNIPIPAFFQNATIRKLAALYERENPGRAVPQPRPKKLSASPLITFQAGGSRPPLFFLHGDWGGGGLYCGYIAQKLDKDRPFHVMSPYRSGKQTILTVPEMVEHHLKVIREHTPHGPYLLGGYCVGATLAIEMARQLLKEGEKVEYLLLVDPPRGKSPSLPWMWRFFDLGGTILNWDLRKKIQRFDRYGCSILRWVRFSLRGKFEGIGRRLGLTTAGAAVVLNESADPDEPDVLGSLDYALYFLAACLYTVEPIHLPATLYFPTETPYTSAREKRARELFSKTTIQAIPGTHLTCISRHPDVLAQKINDTVESLRQPAATRDSSKA